MQPAYQHVLVNHVPVIGLGFAVIALLAAIVIRNRAAQLIGLALVFGASASVVVVNWTGQSAYKEVRGLTDDEGTRWLDEHMERAESAALAFYSLALIAAAGLIVPKRWPKAAMPLALCVVVVGAGCLGLSGWIAKAGGQVRHSEFRTTPASHDEKAEHHHH